MRYQTNDHEQIEICNRDVLMLLARKVGKLKGFSEIGFFELCEHNRNSLLKLENAMIIM